MRIKLKTVLSAAATAALLSGAPGLLLAQQAGTGQLSEIDDDDVVVQPFNLTADQIDDMEVTTVDGETIGEIEEVLADASREPVAVAVEVDDLDLDDEERIIRLDQLRLEAGRFATDLSKSEIEALPVWDD
jgi:hypothetical protein